MSSQNKKALYRYTVLVRFEDGSLETKIFIGPRDEISAEFITEALNEDYSSYRPISEIKLLSSRKSAIEAIDPANFNASTSVSPPALAEFLCACLAPKKRRREILGCLEEDFSRDVTDCGYMRARRRYWAAVLRSSWPLLGRCVERMIWGSLGGAIGKWFSGS